MNTKPEDIQIQVTDSKESLTSSLNQMLLEDLSLSSKVCIFMVPKILRRHSRSAYKPNAFSIGPFHHGKEKLVPTQKIKLKYLQGLLCRSDDPDRLLRQLVEAVWEIHREARDCYAGPVKYSSEEFVRILLLDGCFIIELFRKDADEVTIEPDEPIFSMSCLLEFLKHDLILLENQIPWIVLEVLYNLTTVPGDKSLIALVLDFYANLFSSHKPEIEHAIFANHDIKHILNLLRLSQVLPVIDRLKGSGWQTFPTAKKATESGIKFKNVRSESILDVRFKHGVLEIPPLLVQETTETIFRNLISLEQCLPNCKPVVTSFAILMDNLIDRKEDLDILCEQSVLDKWLNSEDATQMFNKLYTDAYVKEFYYHDVCNQVNAYSKKCWPKWRSVYIQNYFTAPWAVVSQFVAFIFLILGFVQTYYTIATYIHETQSPSAPPPS